jgi:hypothetical protein
MDMTTILGLALLAVGGYWAATNGKKPASDPQAQLADLISQLRPQKPADVLAPSEPSVAKIDRDKAVDAVEVLVDYFEQRGIAEATTPLQSIIQLIFTPTPKV